jgi:hypothetical protein
MHSHSLLFTLWLYTYPAVLLLGVAMQFPAIVFDSNQWLLASYKVHPHVYSLPQGL